jgi:hypothetical protein
MAAYGICSHRAAPDAAALCNIVYICSRPHQVQPSLVTFKDGDKTLVPLEGEEMGKLVARN